MTTAPRPPGVLSPFAVRVLTRAALPLSRLVHRAALSGTERLPEGPYLLVSNHPASLGVAEFAAFLALWASRFRASRPLAAVAYAATFGWWPLSWIFGHVGAIPSTYAAIHAALAAKVPVAIFPGGDHEAFRPLWRGREVDFAGRVGFLRVARDAWVPVVPMGIRGSSAPVVWRSRFLAYLFVWPRISGVKRFGVSVLGVVGAALILTLVPLEWPWRAALAWAWAGSPLALLPWWPATVRIDIGAPLSPEQLFGRRPAESSAGDTAEDTRRLDEALVIVTAAVQRIVSRPSRSSVGEAP